MKNHKSVLFFQYVWVLMFISYQEVPIYIGEIYFRMIQGLGYQVDQHLPLDNSGVLLKAKVRAGGHNRSNHPEQDDDGYLAEGPKITGLIR